MSKQTATLTRLIRLAAAVFAVTAVLSVSASCGDNNRIDRCPRLFGAPGANTGLDTTQCAGSCDCVGSFTAPNYSSGQIEALAERVLIDDITLLSESPYDSPDIDVMENRTAFCGVVSLDSVSYRLETFTSREAAVAASATVTHRGSCGSCSSLQDLAVYMANPDLAGPVRQCGLETLGDGEPETRACLMEIGFTESCAQIWAFNTIHTRENCLSVCLAELDSPYHRADGSLNPCIQCDEDESGPVFKAVAGRTRRNSGLPSALCRPCESIEPIIHQYP